MKFCDYTVLPTRIYSRREQDSTALLPEAVALFQGVLTAQGGSFRAPIPRTPGYELQWTLYGTGAAVATFWAGPVPVTMSLLLAGVEPESERTIIAQTSQTWGMREGLMAKIPERPVILSLILPSAAAASHEALELVADMETCLAAAFFGG